MNRRAQSPHPNHTKSQTLTRHVNITTTPNHLMSRSSGDCPCRPEPIKTVQTIQDRAFPVYLKFFGHFLSQRAQLRRLEHTPPSLFCLLTTLDPSTHRSRPFGSCYVTVNLWKCYIYNFGKSGVYFKHNTLWYLKSLNPFPMCL